MHHLLEKLRPLKKASFRITELALRLFLTGQQPEQHLGGRFGNLAAQQQSFAVL